MLSKLLQNIKQKFIQKDKEYPEIVLLETKEDYLYYANFLVTNFKNVTQGFEITYPSGIKKNFNGIAIEDKFHAIDLLWYKFEQKSSFVYIIEKNKNTIGFAIMETSKLLSYLFIAEEYQQQKIGSLMVNFLRDQHESYTTHIEENKYKNGLEKFYEKNSFIFLKKIINNNQIYYEYKI